MCNSVRKDSFFFSKSDVHFKFNCGKSILKLYIFGRYCHLKLLIFIRRRKIYKTLSINYIIYWRSKDDTARAYFLTNIKSTGTIFSSKITKKERKNRW